MTEDEQRMVAGLGMEVVELTSVVAALTGLVAKSLMTAKATQVSEEDKDMMEGLLKWAVEVTARLEAAQLVTQIMTPGSN